MKLFTDGRLAEHLSQQRGQVISAVTSMNADALLDRTDDEVVADLLGQSTIAPLEIFWERAGHSGVHEGHVDRPPAWYGGMTWSAPARMPGDELRMHVPYTGDRVLFLRQPSTHLMTDFEADVTTSQLAFTIRAPRLTSEIVASHFDRFRQQMTTEIGHVNHEVGAYNRSLEETIRQVMADRRERLLAQRNLTASLPFEIRPSGTPETYAIPVRRKRVHLTTPRPAKPFHPEPALETAIYEDILERIAAFAHAVERTPITVGALDEEGLRDHLLLALNTSYDGQAGGEVFSRAGKTDITVTSGDKHVFVAECKVWNGASKFTKAVDQLLSYLVWRDSKAALVLFIKAGQATDIIAKADAAIAGHPQCARRLNSTDPGSRIDYLLRSTADRERLIHTAFLPVVIAGRTPVADGT